MVEVLNKWEIVKEEFNKLDEELRKFIYEYLERMEGYWGDLANKDERKWHVRVLSYIAPKFAKVFGEWMEEAWKEAITYVKKELADKPIYEQEAWAAEIAFRDFHDTLVVFINAS